MVCAATDVTVYAHSSYAATVWSYLQCLGISSPYFWRTFLPPPTVKRKPIIFEETMGSLNAAVNKSDICDCTHFLFQSGGQEKREGHQHRLGPGRRRGAVAMSTENAGLAAHAC